MISMAGIPRPAPEPRAAVSHVEGALQQLHEVRSTLELIAESYGKSGDDSPVTMWSLVYQIGLQAKALGNVANRLRFKERARDETRTAQSLLFVR